MAGPAKLFERGLLDARRRRALAERQEGADFLLAAAVDDLVDRLGAVKRSFALALDLATPLPILAERLVANAAMGTVLRLDRLAEAIGNRKAGIVGDPEFLPLRAESLDLVASALALQWIEDLPGTLAQIRRVLKPDGLFIANLIGGETLRELRESFAFAEAELTGGAAPRAPPPPPPPPLRAL